MPPSSLHVAWNHGRRINITWDWSPVRRNGQRITEPVTYVVNYVPTGNVSVWMSVNFEIIYPF